MKVPKGRGSIVESERRRGRKTRYFIVWFSDQQTVPRIGDWFNRASLSILIKGTVVVHPE